MAHKKNICIYIYIVQMHIQSEVKNFEVKSIPGFLHVGVHCFARMVSTAVAYNICVFEGVNLVLRHQFLCTQKFWWTP